MTQVMFSAICKATKSSYPANDWYSDNEINELIYTAVKNGWCCRPSHTQCHWTEKGIEAAKQKGFC